jgi:hypothetical protein
MGPGKLLTVAGEYLRHCASLSPATAPGMWRTALMAEGISTLETTDYGTGE